MPYLIHFSVGQVSNYFISLSNSNSFNLQQVGSLEKFIQKHPEAFLIDGREVYVIEDRVEKKSLRSSSNTKDKPQSHDKKSTIDLESASNAFDIYVYVYMIL